MSWLAPGRVVILASRIPRMASRRMVSLLYLMSSISFLCSTHQPSHHHARSGPRTQTIQSITESGCEGEGEEGESHSPSIVELLRPWYDNQSTTGYNGRPRPSHVKIAKQGLLTD